MIITALSNWRPDPGVLLEWHPTAAARELAAAPEIEPTPPSFLQDGHVRSYVGGRDAGRVHNAFLGATTEFDSDLDAPALTRALTTYLGRHEGLRSTFDVVDGQVVRYLVDPAALAFDVTEAGTLDSHEGFLDYVQNRLRAEATPIGWPGFSVGVVSRPGSFTMYYGVDHSLSDGASQVLVISELADLYRSEIDGTPPVDTTAMSHSFLDYARDEREVASRFGPESPQVIDWTRIFTDNGSRMPGFPLDLGLAPGESAPMRPVEVDLLDAAATERFDAVCRAAGGKINSGIFAAVAITEYELAARSHYYGITVLSTRTEQYALSQGWFCNFAPIAFPVEGAYTFTDLVPRAFDAYHRAKRLAEVPVHVVLGSIISSGLAGPEVASSPNLLSYIDFRWFPGAGSPTDKRAILFTGEGRTSNASMWFNRDADHLYLGAQTPDTPAARKSVAAYYDRLTAILTAVANDGDYTLEHTPQKVSAGARHDH